MRTTTRPCEPPHGRSARLNLQAGANQVVTAGEPEQYKHKRRRNATAPSKQSPGVGAEVNASTAQALRRNPRRPALAQEA